MTDQDNVKMLFVTGMFRSGTTLLTRVLDAHANITVGADLFLPLFKAFRNAVQQDLNPAHSLEDDAPLDDYHFRGDSITLFQRLQQADLSRPVGKLNLPLLRERLVHYSEAFAPKVVPYLANLEGDTYFDLLNHAWQGLQRGMGKETVIHAGFKATWSSEFTPHILNAFPDAHVIQIVRDPRATAASSNVRETDKYPLIFLARQWRKLANLAWLYGGEDSPKRDPRVLLIQFEDLVQNERDVSERICEFLDVPFDPAMVKADEFRDGDGKPWVQNTSYTEAKKGFNTAVIDKWRKVLEPAHVRFIEQLAQLEMKRFGYKPEFATEPGFEADDILKPPVLGKELLADWIQPYSLTERDDVIGEMALEEWRYRLISQREPVPDTVKQAVTLDEAVYAMLGAAGKKNSRLEIGFTV